MLCILASTALAQTSQQIALRASYNRLELSCQQTFASIKIWGEPYIGLGNNDIGNKLNDFTFGLKIGYPFANINKSTFDICANVGGYFPNNKQYNAATMVIGLQLGYSLKLGEQGKHLLLVNIGYNYGKRSYSQTYSNSAIMVKTTDTFKISPLYLTIGYAYRI